MEHAVQAQPSTVPKMTRKIPAIIFLHPQSALKIASLTVLDRLVVAIHRGGAGPITVVGEGPVPELKRANALGIPVQTLRSMPGIEGSILVADGNILVQAADVRRCLESRSRLLSNGAGLPIAVVPSTSFAGASSFPIALEKTLGIEKQGVARVITNNADAREAECDLWASLTSSSDGFVDRRFNRPVGRFLSKALIFTSISPNAVSISSIIIGVIAALFFAEGSYRSALIGAILFQISAIVDCVDGDLARVLFKESPLGKWIDFWGDQIVHISVFAGIACGVLRNGGDKETVWLGISAIVGALIACVVVLRGMRQAAGSSGALQKLIDAATNRDFSVLVLALAIAQKLHWFLWLAGVGSHFFWLTALALQLTPKSSAQTR